MRKSIKVEKIKEEIERLINDAITRHLRIKM